MVIFLVTEIKIYKLYTIELNNKGLMRKQMTAENHIYPTSAVHRVIKTSWLTPGLGISSALQQSGPAAANSSATGTPQHTPN